MIFLSKITLAGTIPPLGNRVVSLDVKPVITDLGLELQILKIRSGNLALPDFTWSRPRDMLIDTLQALFLSLAPMAEFDQAGAANPEAISATMAQQGIDSLTNQITHNVLFLPVISESAGLPVRLKSCVIEEGKITITSELLDKEGRDKLLYQLRGGRDASKVPIYLTPSPRNIP